MCKSIHVHKIKKLQVKNSDGEFVSLEGLISFEEHTGTSSINRFDRERKVMVTTGIYETSLDVVMKVVDDKIGEILPAGYNYRYTGDIENMADTNAAFGGAVLLAVILLYLILAALYESLIQPFIIMVAMPLSFTGVIVALYLTGNNFSLCVMIGIILLLGMVGKNAILVVDFANQAIKEGKEALVAAIRTPNLYPIAEYAEKIADTVIDYFENAPAEEPVELVFNDIKLMQKVKKDTPEPETEEKSVEIDDLLDDDTDDDDEKKGISTPSKKDKDDD